MEFVVSPETLRDQPMLDDDPLYARANERPNVQAQSGMQPSGSQGNSPSGRGKKSRKRIAVKIHFKDVSTD